jgi:hypothetical protein
MVARTIEEGNLQREKRKGKKKGKEWNSRRPRLKHEQREKRNVETGDGACGGRIFTY